MVDLLERFAFIGKVARNAGLSFKEAEKSLKAFADSLRFTPHSTTIWSERILDEAKDASFFQREYMQGPVISTHCSHHEKMAEDLDRITERVESMTDRVDNMIGLTDGPPEPELPDQCPSCMRTTTWDLKDYNSIAICDLCSWEFDAWALSNIPFTEMRTQVLELKLRQTEQQLELENARHSEPQMEPQASRPIPIPNPGGRDIASEIRTLMSHRNLTTEQMQRLSELIGLMQGSPPPRLHSNEYAENYEYRPRPLTGQGVSGDSVLEGNEEAMEFTTSGSLIYTSGSTAPIQPGDRITISDGDLAGEEVEVISVEEDGIRFRRIGGSQPDWVIFDEAADWPEAEIPRIEPEEPKPEEPRPVKPLTPPKRKLDV